MPTTSEAIQKQIAALAADLNKQVAIQNLYSQTGTAGIKDAYSGLDSLLRTNLASTTKDVTSGRTGIVNDYRDARAGISQAESTLKELLGNNAMVNSGPLAEVQRLAAEQRGSRADSLSSFDILGGGYRQAGRMAIGDAAKEGVQQQGDLRSQIGAEIGELQRQHLKERSALEVQYAQVLADEKYRAEQMALERQKLAAENAARAEAAAQRRAEMEANAPRYRGKEGLMAWAESNGINASKLNAILGAINKGNVLDDPSAAYAEVNRIVSGRTQKDSDGKFKRVVGPLLFRPQDLDILNTGLDIYYGKYAGYAE